MKNLKVFLIVALFTVSAFGWLPPRPNGKHIPVPQGPAPKPPRPEAPAANRDYLKGLKPSDGIETAQSAVCKEGNLTVVINLGQPKITRALDAKKQPAMDALSPTKPAWIIIHSEKGKSHGQVLGSEDVRVSQGQVTYNLTSYVGTAKLRTADHKTGNVFISMMGKEQGVKIPCTFYQTEVNVKPAEPILTPTTREERKKQIEQEIRERGEN